MGRSFFDDNDGNGSSDGWDWWENGTNENIEKCKCGAKKVGESMIAADERLGKCCDNLIDTLGIKTNWAKTADISLSFTAGAGGTSGFDAVFFAKTCEIGIFGVVPRGGGVPSIGWDAGLSLAGSYAFYGGSGSGGSDTWKGPFDSLNGGVGIGVGGYYWGSGWYGISGGVGWGLPVSSSYNQTDYRLIWASPVPKAICCALRLKGPTM